MSNQIEQQHLTNAKEYSITEYVQQLPLSIVKDATNQAECKEEYNEECKEECNEEYDEEYDNMYRDLPKLQRHLTLGGSSIFRKFEEDHSSQDTSQRSCSICKRLSSFEAKLPNECQGHKKEEIEHLEKMEKMEYESLQNIKNIVK